MASGVVLAIVCGLKGSSFTGVRAGMLPFGMSPNNCFTLASVGAASTSPAITRIALLGWYQSL